MLDLIIAYVDILAIACVFTVFSGKDEVPQLQTWQPAPKTPLDTPPQPG